MYHNTVSISYTGVTIIGPQKSDSFYVAKIRKWVGVSIKYTV